MGEKVFRWGRDGGEMVKVGGATTAKKKKGRPSLLDLKNRVLKKEELQNQQKLQRISTRRNPSSTAASSGYYVSANEDEYYDDDDDERREKKVKLVVRLPQSNQLQQQQASSDLIRYSSVNSASYFSELNDDVDNWKFNSGSVDTIIDYQGEKISKAMESSGPTTPLPDKKLLDFILDRLQKKDTYGAFSEPVDPNELPDYHEIVKHPMDFGTVKNKLDDGVYSNLNELEADVLLICSNAMKYNSSDTIYFRQARNIQELAKRDFGNLRQEGEEGELQPKVVKRGRPPSKHLKKPPGRPPLERVGPESATLATPEDNTTESTPYNLRRGPMLHNSCNREQPYSELLSEWNEEFPVRIRRADMKYGNIKDFVIDESRRETYKQYYVSNFCGEKKQLMVVGDGDGYARSLACFAANLGPVVWKVALKKMDKALPCVDAQGTTVESEGIFGKSSCWQQLEGGNGDEGRQYR